MSVNKKLATAALAGLLSVGAVATAAHAADNLGKGVQVAEASQSKEKHACKGQNSCKGNGADGQNSCKGKGSCRTDGGAPASN